MIYLYFSVLFDGDDAGGVADSSWSPDSFRLPEFAEKGEIPLHFELREGEREDYQGNSLAWPLMSARMKAVLDACRTPESLRWLPVLLIDRDGSRLDYYIPYFSKVLDVLNKEKTIFVTETLIMKAHYDRAKLGDLEFFVKPWSISSLVVSRRVMKEMKKLGLTGISFEPIPSS